MPRTLFEKIWDAHVVRDLGGGWALLHIDRHLLHDLSGTAGAGRDRQTQFAGAQSGTHLRRGRPRGFQRAGPQRADLRTRRALS